MKIENANIWKENRKHILLWKQENDEIGRPLFTWFMLESIYAEVEINYHNNAEKPQCVGQRCSGITVRRSIR